MAWTGTITNAGRELLNAWTGEAQLVFEGAQAGQGLVDSSQLAAQTALTDKQQDGGIVGKETAESGVRLKIRLTAADKAYEMTQIGVLASVDSGAPVLLALFQQDEGVPIPAFADSPDFAYTFYALITCSNTGSWTVSLDTAALATLGDVQEALSSLRPAVLELVIPAVGWEAAQPQEQEGYEYRVNVSVPEANETLTPAVVLYGEALSAAREAGLCPTVQSLSGSLRFWSRQPPARELTATLVLTPGGAKDGGGASGGYFLPVATKTRLGGVKIGENIDVTDDGTISAAGGTVSDEDMATDTEVGEILDEVFSEE